MDRLLTYENGLRVVVYNIPGARFRPGFGWASEAVLKMPKTTGYLILPNI